MPSPQLILAAQTNGKLSQGPVTPEGKRKSSANSRKHGLRAKTLQTDEACEAHRKWLLPHLIVQHNPASPIEFMLIETLAQASARQDWALRISDQYHAEALEHQSNPEAPYDHPGRHAIELLHRAFSRFAREERRAVQQLRQLKSQPHPPAQPLPEANPFSRRTRSPAPVGPQHKHSLKHGHKNERTNRIPRATHHHANHKPSPQQHHQQHPQPHRPPLTAPHKLKSINRNPFAPSPACGNPKRT